MYIFLIQLVDLFTLHSVALFLVFYVLSVASLVVRLVMSTKYKVPGNGFRSVNRISVVLPVFGEDVTQFWGVLKSLKRALEATQIPYEVFVVENGSHRHRESAESFGFQYEMLVWPSKRKAIAHGVMQVTGDVTVLLDSDTIIPAATINQLLYSFSDKSVGGVVPRQEVSSMYGYGIMNRLCDWYEDICFGNTTPGLSANGAVPCLIGRLYMVRTAPLKEMMPTFTDQWLFGQHMETGDDRVITSGLLERGYKTVYDREALVYTFAPTTLKVFAKQRLRWSRSSFRETLLTTPWLWKHPYAFFVMWSDILIRWLFLAVLANFVIRAATGTLSPHYLQLPWWSYLVGGAIGFFVSGWIKQIPHLLRKPEDFWYTPLFLLLTTFVLFPVEVYGNLTFWVQGWLTRSAEPELIQK